MKRLPIGIVLLLQLFGGAAGARRTPEALYREAYLTLRKAIKADYESNPDVAWLRFSRASILLAALRREHPGWNPEGVSAQLARCEAEKLRRAPLILRETERRLGEARRLAQAVGAVQGRKVAFKKQFDWQRRKLEEIEDLVIEFAREEKVRRILGKESGEEVSPEEEELALEEGEGAREAIDSDGDGLSDMREEDLGTDPGDADTDDDGYFDGDEVKLGYEPLSDDDHPLIFEVNDYDESNIDWDEAYGDQGEAYGEGWE